MTKKNLTEAKTVPDFLSKGMVVQNKPKLLPSIQVPALHKPRNANGSNSSMKPTPAGNNTVTKQ